MTTQTTPLEVRLTNPHAFKVATKGGTPVFAVDTLTLAAALSGRFSAERFVAYRNGDAVEFSDPIRVDPNALGHIIEGQEPGEAYPRARLSVDRLSFGDSTYAPDPVLSYNMGDYYGDLELRQETLLTRHHETPADNAWINSWSFWMLGVGDTDPGAGITPTDRGWGLSTQFTAVDAVDLRWWVGDPTANWLRMTLTDAGQLQIETTGATGGLLVGGDVNLYRSAANLWATADAFEIGLHLAMVEQAGDPVQVANQALLYSKDDGGVTKMYYRMSDGTVVGPLTDVGALHAPVTLGGGSDPALALAGQQLTLADVLTPAEHTAIGAGAPHHAQAHGPGQHTTGNAWNALYLDALGDEIELALGAAGTYYRCAGVAAAPTMSAILGGDVPGVHSGTAHHAQAHAAADHNAAVLAAAFNENLGAFYLDIDDIAVPANPGASIRRLFVNQATGELSVRTAAGATVSLEAVGGVAAHAILDGVVHTDSVAQAVTQGSLIVGNASPLWDELVIGAAGTYLRSDAADPSWSAIQGGDIPGVHSGTAHHAAVTLAADADVLLGLVGQQLQLDAQAANIVFAGPAAGGAVDPTFRALVDADIPGVHAGSAHHAQAHGPAQHTTGNAWKALYLDALGDEQEVALGAIGTYLRCAGPAIAPTVSAIQDLDVPGVHTGTAHHAQAHAAAQHNAATLPAGFNEDFGAFYYDIGEIAVPANPGANVRRVFLDNGTGKLSVRTSAGATVSLEEIAGVAAHALLDGTVHTDSLADAVTAGSIIIGNDTPKWDELVIAVPAANVRNVLGIDNAETTPSWKTALDGVNPANIGAVAPGTSLVFSHRDHIHAHPAALGGDLHHNEAHAAAQHNAAVLMAGANENLGAFYLDIDDIAVPANPAASIRRLFTDTATGKLSVRTSAGATVSLEEVAGVAAHNLLDGVVHPDTVLQGCSRGSLIYGNSGLNWDELVVGAVGTFLRADGADVYYGTILDADIPGVHSGTAHHAIYTDAMAILAVEGHDPLDLLGDLTIAVGKSLAVDTIGEKGAGTGVTIDDVLLKDGHVQLGVGDSIKDSGGTVRFTPGATNIITGDFDVNSGMMALGSEVGPEANIVLNLRHKFLNSGVSVIGQNIDAYASFTSAWKNLTGVYCQAKIDGSNVQNVSTLTGGAFIAQVAGSGRAAEVWGGHFRAHANNAAETTLVNDMAAGMFDIDIEDLQVDVASAIYITEHPGATVTGRLTDQYGIQMDALTLGTNRYGLYMADIAGGTIARLLELGPTPYLRLYGSGEWTPAANQTPLDLVEGVVPTRRNVRWKDGAAIGAGDKVMVMV